LKFSIRLNNDLPVAEYVELAKIAEEMGFDQFWVSDDLFLRSAPVILTAIAIATKRIEIGSCILNPYTIHPAEMAMMAATLDEVSNGRFNLGISSGAADFLQWIGIHPKKPRSDLLETIQVLRALFAGESVAINGQFMNWTNEAYMRFKPRRQVPIYIGAMSPKMLRSIGEIADGGLPLLFPPEHYKNVYPYIAEGAAKAGRSIDTIDIAACIWCSISEDSHLAQEPLKEKIAYYGHAMSPMIMKQLGLERSDFTEIEHAIMKERNLDKAKSMVNDSMLKIGLSGTANDIIERLEALVELGVNHLSFGPPLGPDLGEAIRLIGTKIIPHFRGQQK
jgi:5,10-methylenetetrahydromethanopterin reductase